jgi:hypothetical protein
MPSFQIILRASQLREIIITRVALTSAQKKKKKKRVALTQNYINYGLQNMIAISVSKII